MLFSFILFHTIPGDPARIILGPYAEESRVLSLRKELGLDAPVHVQFFNYLKDISQLDFGRSYVDQRPVLDEVVKRFGISLHLIVFCLLFIFSYNIFVVQTIYSRKSTDFINFLFVSTPTFFSGLVVALIAYRYLPVYSFSGSFNSVRDYFYFVPPAFVLALYPMAILSRILAKELDKVLTNQYILAARAFALPERMIFYKYALRNAAVPYLAAFSNQLPMFFTGAFIVEIIFSIPGVGSLLVRSILQQDFPMIEGIIILNGIIFIMINLFFEMLYPLIDPRINKA